jgi:AI-2 transport system permease protein
MKTLLKNRELSAFLAILALFVVLVALNPFSACKPWA